MMAVVTNFSISGRDIRKETDNWMLNFEKQFTDLKIFFFNFPDDGVDTQSGTKKEDGNDKEKKDEEDAPAPARRAKSIVESWVWGRQPGPVAMGFSGFGG